MMAAVPTAHCVFYKELKEFKSPHPKGMANEQRDGNADIPRFTTVCYAGMLNRHSLLQIVVI